MGSPMSPEKIHRSCNTEMDFANELIRSKTEEAEMGVQFEDNLEKQAEQKPCFCPRNKLQKGQNPSMQAVKCIEGKCLCSKNDANGTKCNCQQYKPPACCDRFMQSERSKKTCEKTCCIPDSITLRRMLPIERRQYYENHQLALQRCY